MKENKNTRMTKMRTKTAEKQLMGWNPESAKERLLEHGFEGSPCARNGYLLYERAKIDQKIIDNLIQNYMLEKRIEFLKKAPKDAVELLGFRNEYIDEMFNKRHLFDEAKQKVKIEDSINEESFLSFLVNKYRYNGFKKIKEIKQIIKSLNPTG